PEYVPANEILDSSDALASVTAVTEGNIVYMPADTYTNESIQTYTEFFDQIADALEGKARATKAAADHRTAGRTPEVRPAVRCVAAAVIGPAAACARIPQESCCPALPSPPTRRRRAPAAASACSTASWSSPSRWPRCCWPPHATWHDATRSEP